MYTEYLEMIASKMKQLKAYTIGSKAYEILEFPLEMVVLGTTYRGIFLETSTKWIIFLSREQFRGPLTINLEANTLGLGKVQKGMRGTSERHLITFPQADISVQLGSAEIWIPPPPTGTPPNLTTIRASLAGLDDPFISAILNPDKAVDTTLLDIQQRALLIYSHMRLGDWKAAEETALSLLGRGTGLTPEGDDFLIGLCFHLARSGNTSPVSDTLHTIVIQAYKRTTLMSANLIEVAAEGLADERLVAAHDALLRGSPDAQNAINTLLDWGSTSGCMALAGIISGVLSTR
jgi:hypothetical protein